MTLTNPELLTRLPDEVLLIILHDLSEKDLLALALLSRRLHRIALPIYFSYFDLEDPTTSSTPELALSHYRADALPGLSAALAITPTTIGHIYYVFKGSDTLPRDILRFGRVVANLISVEHITLDFNLKIITASWEEDLLRSLLDTIVDKSCKKLTLHYARIRKDADPLRMPTESAPQSFPLLPSFSFNSLKKLGRKDRSSFGLSKKAPRAGLINLNIHNSLMLLKDPLYSWTIRTLNTAPLASVSFHDLCLRPKEWADVLPKIKIPTLCELSFVACRLAYADLSKFLSCHPNITDLTLGRGLGLPSRTNHIDLPRLAVLNATPEYIQHLLAPTHTLKQLSSVTIRLENPYDQPDKYYSEIESCLDCVSNHPTARMIGLAVHLSSRPKLEKTEMRDRTLEFHGQISRVELSVSYSFHKTEKCVKWLANSFPKVRHVQFLGSSFSWMDRSDEIRFIREIRKAAGTVQTVRIGDRMHSVRGWLDQGKK